MLIISLPSPHPCPSQCPHMTVPLIILPAIAPKQIFSPARVQYHQIVLYPSQPSTKIRKPQMIQVTSHATRSPTICAMIRRTIPCRRRRTVLGMVTTLTPRCGLLTLPRSSIDPQPQVRVVPQQRPGLFHKRIQPPPADAESRHPKSPTL